jgi:hypothetical protein
MHFFTTKNLNSKKVHLVGGKCNWTKMHGIHGIKKQFYFYMFDVIIIFCIYLPSWPNINTPRTIEDHKRFSVFTVDH